MKVRLFRQDADPGKQAAFRLLSHPRDLLVTLIILNVAMNIMVQNVVAGIFGDLSGWVLNVGVPMGLTLIFGEVIPKSIGMARNASIAPKVAPLLVRLQRVLLPLRYLLVKITESVSRILFFFLRREKEISLDELQHALRASRKIGVLAEDEAELVRGYLGLQESTVKERMRPREEVLYFDLEEPLSRLIHLFVDEECSRVPICEGGLDNIIGVLTTRLFFLYREELTGAADLREILDKPFFVPETTAARTLLRQFYDRQESLAIVVDEYGSVSGLISVEDLVEVVVGEIADLRDEPALYSRPSEDVIIASGKLELTELETIFDASFTSEHQMVTLGGYLTEKIGDIPKSGTKYTFGDFFYHVLAAEPTRVRRVYVRRLTRRA
jgi:CBS domain containing-hemolysin-like protein